jgi:hypothetical protein
MAESNNHGLEKAVSPADYVFNLLGEGGSLMVRDICQERTIVCGLLFISIILLYYSTFSCLL